MKLVIIAALVAFAAADPRPQVEGGNFSHVFEDENGVSQSKIGLSPEDRKLCVPSRYSYPLPDGSIATFIADADGYRVESPLLPVAPDAEHPIPAHIQEQIAFNDAQRAAGLTWDQVANAWV